MGLLEQQVADNAANIKKIIDDATKIGALPPLASLVNVNDEIALDIKATGQTVKTTIGQLIQGGVGTSVVRHPITIPFNFDLNNKTDLNSLHGALTSRSVDGIVLSSGTDIVAQGGQSKVFMSVNAGSDLVGTITITGTSVNRDTGVETGSDTEDIVINGLTSDSSTTDGNGNDKHSYSNAYVSDKLFIGAVTLSTTDVNLSDISLFEMSFEQFNDYDNITLNDFDLSYLTSNTSAVMDAYLYSVEVVDNVAVVSLEAELHHVTGGTVGKYAKRRGNIAKSLDGTTDGVFLDLFLNPGASEYFSNFTSNIRSEHSENVSVVVDGSLGLDNIVYGETLQIGHLAYLKSDGKYYKADNTAESTSTTELRLIIEAGVVDDEKLSLAKGQYTSTGFTAGLEYVGTTGTITSTRPTNASEVVRIVSTAISATVRYFDPSKTWIAGDASKINGVSIAGASNEFLDGLFKILNSSDQTKKLDFDLSTITSGITRTISWQDKSGIPAFLSDIAIIVDGEVAIHNEGTPATTWNFNHALDFLNPAIQVWDSAIAGAKVIVPEEIIAVDENNCQITFPEAVSGRAIATRGGTNTASLTSDIDTLAKLNAIVADATLVDTGDIVLQAETTTASMGFVIDEDNMASDLATKIPTQQSVKAYVDASIIADDQTASEVPIVDAGSIIAATEVEGALQENRTAIDLNTSKDTNIVYPAETTTTIGALINGADAKVTPVDTDLVPIRDVTGGLLEKVTWVNIKATLKSYFDTLYNLYTHPNHTGEVTSTGDGATVLVKTSITNRTTADAVFDDRILISDASDSDNLKKAYIPESQAVAIGDETTDIETGTSIFTFTMPNYATKLTWVSASLIVAPTDSTAIFDLNEAGTSVLSTKISIDIGEFTSETAATPPVISDSTIAANAILTADLDQVGSTIAGAGPKMRIYYTRA